MGFWDRLRGRVQHENTGNNALSITVDLNTTTNSGYTGNPYATYTDQTLELSRKFEGTATWGVQPTQNLITVRSAFQISGGVKPIARREAKDASKELEIIRAFMRHNNLDEEKPLEWAREVEIEGKFLARLTPEKEAKAIRVRYVPWTQHRYKITPDPGDYERYLAASYKVNNEDSAQDVNMKPGEFIFAPFGGRVHMIENTTTKIGGVLRHIEALDKALADWRKINHLFASPTPTFTMEDKEGVDAVMAWISSQKWTIGRFLAFSGGKFEMVVPSIEGVKSLLDEIVHNAKVISGATGVPVHFLGLPDLMSNRATAENLMELIGASTVSERRRWTGVYDEMFRKVLIMHRETYNEDLDPEVVTAEITLDNAQAAEQVKDLWIDLVSGEHISQETFLSKIPGIDPEEEAERLKAEKEARMEDMKKSFPGVQPFQKKPTPGEGPAPQEDVPEPGEA